MEDKSAAQQINAIIKKYDDWRGEMLSCAGSACCHAGASTIQLAVAGRKPDPDRGVSRPCVAHTPCRTGGHLMKRSALPLFRGLYRDPF